MGKHGQLPFLNDAELEEFNSIGYSGKTTKGEKISLEDYLNSLNKGEFQVTQTKFGDDDWIDNYTIVWIDNKTVLSYAKEKLAITQKMIDEDNGLDYGHSQYLCGTYNAYDDIIFELEHGFKIK
jgi:hypothetical protein